MKKSYNMQAKFILETFVDLKILLLLTRFSNQNDPLFLYNEYIGNP